MALVVMRAAQPASAVPPAKPLPSVPARHAFRKAPYLFSLAALVILGTSSAAAVDWVFKSQAAGYFGRGEPLMRFFALFH